MFQFSEKLLLITNLLTNLLQKKQITWSMQAHSGR